MEKDLGSITAAEAGRLAWQGIPPERRSEMLRARARASALTRSGCRCGHLKGQHASLGLRRCAYCKCKKYTPKQKKP